MLPESAERCPTGPQSPKWRQMFWNPLVSLLPSPKAGVTTPVPPACPAWSFASPRRDGLGVGVGEVTFQGETGSDQLLPGDCFPVWRAWNLCPARTWRAENLPTWGRHPEPACRALTPHLTPRGMEDGIERGWLPSDEGT